MVRRYAPIGLLVLLLTPAFLIGNTSYNPPSSGGGGGGMGDPGANGMMARTALNTSTARTLTAGTGISVSNGDGVSGNPTTSVDTATTPQFSSGTGDAPGTCTLGEIYIETDQKHVCTCSSTNTWVCNDVLILDAEADGISNNTYNGVVLNGWDCGESISQWDTVYLDDTANEWLQADADAAGEFPARGVAVAACTNGNPGIILVQGIVRNDAWTWTANGATLFLGDTPGGITQTAPSTTGDAVQVVGFTFNDDQVYLNFSGHYLEVQ